VAKSVEIKIPEDIEYRVIGNAFGLLICSAGLLAGEMVRLRSFDYWPNDIVPLIFVAWMSFRIYRNFLSTLVAYPGATAPKTIGGSATTSVRSVPVIAGRIADKSGPSADQVLNEVAKRISAKKEDAVKKNKFTN
jgi:hypothetical protein